MCPITKSLLQGNKFPFALLYGEPDAVEVAWDHWWTNYPGGSEIVRPEVIAPSDLILRKTIHLDRADTVSYNALFEEHLGGLISSGVIKRSPSFPRAELRSQIADYLEQRCSVIEDTPSVFFLGGGYGSGKSSILTGLLQMGRPEKLRGLTSIVGVDICKKFIPEYNLVGGVYDGRASEISQDEARLISEDLFYDLLEKRKSFVWDSSFSNPTLAFQKLNAARESGYQVGLVGVLTDPEVALRRAMVRAKQIVRFPPPGHFHSSHSGFRENLESYWDFVDFGVILENSEDWKDPVRTRQKNLQPFGL